MDFTANFVIIWQLFVRHPAASDSSGRAIDRPARVTPAAHDSASLAGDPLAQSIWWRWLASRRVSRVLGRVIDA